MYHRGFTAQSWIFALDFLVLHNLCLLDMNRYTLLMKTEETQMHKQRKRQRELIQLLREALPKFWCSQWKARVATSSILFALSSQYSQLLIEWLYREMHCGERICTLLLQSCHTNGLQNPKRALTVTEQEDAEDALEAVSKYIRRKTWEKHIIRLSANKGLTLALSHVCWQYPWCSLVLSCG